jgi:hypothetical protein
MVYFGFRSLGVICPNYLEFKQEMREGMHVTRCPSRWIIHHWQLEDLFLDTSILTLLSDFPSEFAEIRIENAKTILVYMYIFALFL